MATRRFWPIALLLLGAFTPAAALACSRVLSNSNGQSAVVGRTMDLYLNDRAALVLRPRGLEAGGLVSTSVPNAKRCLLYTSPSPRDKRQSRMPSSA